MENSIESNSNDNIYFATENKAHPTIQRGLIGKANQNIHSDYHDFIGFKH